MQLPTTRAISLVLITAITACATQGTQPGSDLRSTPTSEDPPFTVVRDQVDHKLAPGVATVVIDNPYGDIQVRKTQSRSIGAAIVEQRIGETPRTARLEWFVDGARQGLRVRYAEHDPVTPANPRLGRVDLGIFVPTDAALELRTDFGSITVRRVGTHVAARSRTGKIVVAASGVLELESSLGEVRSFPMSSDWEGTARVSTAGNAVVWIPQSDTLDLVVRATDDLFPNFDLDHSEQDAQGTWKGTLRRGSGTTRLEVSGGDVVLLGDSDG